MDKFVLMVLLHENGYKAVALGKCSDSSQPVTPEVPATKAVDLNWEPRGIISRVKYRPVSHHHKCPWCADSATQEAIQGQQNLTVISRCCDNPKCIWLSKEKCERLTE